ncbi:hypothetical protein AAWM_10676 [Aspergillus awamori]|uniref:Uncharacterized protein n=2 Tax=Aspergillus TaxID=5052 RepID=A0A3F3QED6_9EURO|nr:hypothetical protein BDQ94DRAFT_136699 [Aspergillus welwitschiae]GCB27791.1 hypothetical protein AAWM_10676 [Aspergillus awamori]GKZ54038.1 hypothetical protein AnigIFM49718_008826 [Aspergillus niger]RDH37593.1 hypothetical protein BDQ94DRAFT_136699 [Aspergillus welwitschiae]GLA20485.1 hypothetical protein AnigIFM62618_009060 [Aspergillus niger]GLA44241.1 hypothetical protein AnigIFM63309_002827 [Aspergillus niger]
MQPSQENQSNQPDRPGTPPRPPYSPVTPVFAHLVPATNAATGNGAPHPIVPPAASPSPTTRVPPYGSLADFTPPAAAPVFAPEPAAVPISESENPDAIALRSAISILQLQKQQSMRDIKTLEKFKKAAAEDPEGFARELAAGNLSAKDTGAFINFTHDKDSEDEDVESPKRGVYSGLGTLPTPQNVVRMPPINWNKYQIVGEPLDKMHEEQRRRPTSGEPRRDDTAQRAPEHVVASPYRPLVDKLESPGKNKGTNRNKKT